MVNKGMIKMLQGNETPYGLLRTDMQEAMKEIGKQNFLLYNADNSWGKIICVGYLFEYVRDNGNFHIPAVYQLRDDYKEDPPKFEEIRVEVMGNGVLVYHRYRGTTLDLHIALSDEYFVGFKYKNGKITAAARMYEKKGTYYSKDLKDIQEGCVVHMPTHVVFRVPK